MDYKLLLLSQKLNYKKGIAFGNFDRAIYIARSVILKGFWESSCLLNMGLSYYNLGNYKEALACMFSGLEIKEEMNDKHGMASGYINIRNIYEVQGNYPEALKF